MTKDEKALLLSMIANGFEFRNEQAVINGKEYETEELSRVAALAEEIFEKNTPKKPLEICEPVVKWGICPTCHGEKRTLGGRPNRCFENDEYCRDCGQRLDWSE